jgi:hypothetical protein
VLRGRIGSGPDSASEHPAIRDVVRRVVAEEAFIDLGADDRPVVHDRSSNRLAVYTRIVELVRLIARDHQYPVWIAVMGGHSCRV